MPHNVNHEGKLIYYRALPVEDGFALPMWRMEIGSEGAMGAGVFWRRYGALHAFKEDALSAASDFAKYVASKR
jgi:hypothetical protein